MSCTTAASMNTSTTAAGPVATPTPAPINAPYFTSPKPSPAGDTRCTSSNGTASTAAPARAATTHPHEPVLADATNSTAANTARPGRTTRSGSRLTRASIVAAHTTGTAHATNSPASTPNPTYSSRP